MGDLGDHAEIVGDEQHAGALTFLQLGDQLQDLGWVVTSSAVVARRRSAARIEAQGHGDHDALALAARELVRVGA